jgi:hypothetical protein
VDRPPAIGGRPLLTLLDAHLTSVGERGIGVGPDPYNAATVTHPMALALYARGLAEMPDSDAMAPRLELATALGEQLVGAAAGGAWAWGLGFGWDSRDAGEPYAITTALCGHALLSLYAATGSERHRRAAGGAADWLCEGLAWPPMPGTDHAGPAYSPALPYAIPNVTSMVAGFLWRATTLLDASYGDRAETATRAVVDAQAHGCWTYGELGDRDEGSVPRTTIVDMLHSSYTLAGLAECVARAPALAPRRASCAAAAQRALSSGLAFVATRLVTPRGWCREKVVVADTRTEAGAALANRPGLRRHEIADGIWIVAFPAESRLWGYGGWLSTVARAVDGGLADAELLLPALSYVLAKLTVDPSARFPYTSRDRHAWPRQEAHLFEGLGAARRAVAEDAT